MTARERRIIYSVAASADGFISRSDGDVDWLEDPRSSGDHGMTEFWRSVDTVLMGRRTWDFGVSFGQPRFGGKKNYVFTRSPSPRRRALAKRSRVELVSGEEPVQEFARRLRREKGKDIWLVGGASLFASFLDAGEVDRIVVHVKPILIGEGVPLVEAARRTIPLRLVSSKKFPDGAVRLEYAVPH
jgi:dihydrofolate reductase